MGMERILSKPLLRFAASLLEAGVQDLMPRTSFEVANETLGLWATEYPSTLADFKSLLSRHMRLRTRTSREAYGIRS